MIDYQISQHILDALLQSGDSGRRLRRRAMVLLDELPGYDWSGVYRLEGDTLLLDEYIGAETDHTRIPVGTGVCGTAVAEGKNQIVQDVRTLDNYLACSLDTRSELVVLIRDAAGRILGQIDIDGHHIGAYDHSDEQLLEQIAAILAERW